jgi:hypothetical protein
MGAGWTHDPAEEIGAERIQYRLPFPVLGDHAGAALYLKYYWVQVEI